MIIIENGSYCGTSQDLTVAYKRGEHKETKRKLIVYKGGSMKTKDKLKVVLQIIIGVLMVAMAIASISNPALAVELQDLINTTQSILQAVLGA